jgi:CRP-like cAMP-binding protein
VLGRFYTVTRGIVARAGKVISTGDYFGTDALIISIPRLLDMRAIKSLSYVELACITREAEEFYDVLARYPASQAAIRQQASLRLAMRRAMPLVGGVGKKLRIRRTLTKLGEVLKLAAAKIKMADAAENGSSATARPTLVQTAMLAKQQAPPLPRPWESRAATTWA